MLQLLLYLYGQILDRTLPLGNLAFGVSVFSILAVYYHQNRLWGRIPQTPWVLPFLIYIAISFVWGFYRYKTPTGSVFDLWLLTYIPLVLLIPPFSFNVRTFDTCLAVLVGAYILMALVLVGIFPETLYDRAQFSHYIRIPAMLGAGAVYLLLKYASRISIFTLIGLIGVLFDGVLYGVGGAFRSRMVLALLALLLFFLILLRSSKVTIGWKFLTITVGTIACAVALFLVSTRFQEQFYVVLERFTSLADRFDKTGDVASSDSRLKEAEYFFMLNPNYKLILGHGVGALWYDFHGMFGEASGGAFAGARRMLHLNWLNIVFKIGIVGSILLYGMLISHWRRHSIFLKQNLGWWAFLIYYSAYTTVYGDKELAIRSVIFLIALIHPWLFHTESVGGRRRPIPMGRPGYPPLR